MSRILITFLLTLLTNFSYSDGLQITIERIVKDSGLSSQDKIGISIRLPNRNTESEQDNKFGSKIVEYNDEEFLVPASNQKLLSTGAALNTLGKEFIFETNAFIQTNSLFIVGDGDPSFGDPKFVVDNYDLSIKDHSESFIKEWIDILKEREQSLFSIYIDDYIFVRDPLYHPDWPTNQRLLRYCPEISALSYHGNTIHFFPRITNSKKANIDTFAPFRSDLKIQNLTVTKSKNKATTVGIVRSKNDNNFTVKGSVTGTYWKKGIEGTIHDPAIFFGNTIANRLRVEGIGVAKVERKKFIMKEGDNKLIKKIQTPVQKVINFCNKNSDNLYAECLLRRSANKALGQPVKWNEAASWLESLINRKLNISNSSLIIRDGSGMSRINKISASILSKWIESFPPGEGLFKSLPLAKKEGTLANRFNDYYLDDIIIRAKSGYLNNVSTLSGYIVLPTNEWCTVSVLINLKDGSIKNAKKLQEKVFIKTSQWLKNKY